jgi:hypothetical protein
VRALGTVFDVNEGVRMHEMLAAAARPLSEAALRVWTRVTSPGRDRGDVPGWVLVTIMTAGLVTALWLVADDKLKELFSEALDGVVGNAP